MLIENENKIADNLLIEGQVGWTEVNSDLRRDLKRET